jgi:hypothetical protein
MNTVLIHPNYDSIPLGKQHETILFRFLNWSKHEEKNRIAWLGISIIVMTAIFFPVTMVSILMNGADFRLIIGAMISLILVVVPNLAALPTKYTIPALLTGVLMDVILIIVSFFI